MSDDEVDPASNFPQLVISKTTCRGLEFSAMTITTPGALVWGLINYVLTTKPVDAHVQNVIAGLVSITTIDSDPITVREYIRGPSLSPPRVQIIFFSCLFANSELPSGLLQTQYEEAYVINYGSTPQFEAPFKVGVLISGPDNTQISASSTDVSARLIRTGSFPGRQIRNAQLATPVEVTPDSPPSGVIYGNVPEENWVVAVTLGVGTIGKTVLV